MPQQVHEKPCGGTEHFTHLREHTQQWQEHMECGWKKCGCQLGAGSEMQAVCRAVRSLDSFLEWPFFSRVLEQQKNNLAEYKGLHIGWWNQTPSLLQEEGSPTPHPTTSQVLSSYTSFWERYMICTQEWALRTETKARGWRHALGYPLTCSSRSVGAAGSKTERELFRLPSSLSQTCTASHICTSTVANAPPWGRMLIWIMGEDFLMFYPVTRKMAVHELGQG